MKSLGDGASLAVSAVAAAFAIQQACHRDNVGRPADSHIMLRIGIEIADVLIVQHGVSAMGKSCRATLHARGARLDRLVQEPIDGHHSK